MITLLLLSIACAPGEAGLSPRTVETADTAGPTDTGADTDTMRSGPWCEGWEDGTLLAWGYPGAQADLASGAVVANVAEGGDWSALRGEEQIVLDGDHAAILRSSHEGDPTSMAVGTTEPFVATEAALTWVQLSEVDKRGVWLGLELLDADGAALASADIPVETGGFLPGLKASYASIPGLDDITVNTGTPGEPVAQGVDLSPWAGQTVQLRFLQHTRIDGDGFFSLFDDLCAASGDGLDLIALDDGAGLDTGS